MGCHVWVWGSGYTPGVVVRKQDPDRVVRPTIRCLLEDIGATEAEPETLASSLHDAASAMDSDPRFLFPIALTDARHLVLDRANALATDDAAHREPIAALADHGVVKVKASDRRGALWSDHDGTWWLLAVGRRKDDGPGDFYRDLEARAGILDSIAPTEADYRYQRYEAAYLAECAREREAQLAILRALLVAAAQPGTEQQVEVFGAVVSITVDADEDAAELTLSFDFTNFEERDRFPVDLIGFVPGHENIDGWDYLPALQPDQPESWYTLVHPSRIEAWAVAEELDSLLSGPELQPEPVTTTQLDVAHMAPAGAVTMGYVEGTEIAALCGARFTPHRDPDHFDVCEACDDALQLLRMKRPRSMGK